MRRNRLFIIVASFGTAAAVAAWLDVPARTRAEPTLTKPVIGHLVGRNHLITITAGGDQPRYSVHRDGQTVAEAVTLEELKSIDPESHRQLDSATTSSGAPTIWAGLEVGGE